MMARFFTVDVDAPFGVGNDVIAVDIAHGECTSVNQSLLMLM
jgi:hypothetical protein